MRLVFNDLKAAQAAAYLVNLRGGRMNVMALIKLLYLADRKALIERGYPITGDAMVSMPHGPVLSRIYDSIQWGKRDGDPWYEYLSERADHDVSLVKGTIDPDELSDYEIEVLEEIFRDYGQLGPFQLRDLTHDLPEWTDPQGSSLPIDPTDILRAAGKSGQDVEIISRAAERFYLVAQLLNRRPSKVA